jgi:hypothetical protein
MTDSVMCLCGATLENHDEAMLQLCDEVWGE